MMKTPSTSILFSFQKLTAIFISLVLGAPTYAATSTDQQMSLEGVVTDVSGNPVDLTGVSLTFYISAQAADGSMCFLHNESSTTAGDNLGNVSYRFGSGASGINPFSYAVFNGVASGTNAASVPCVVNPAAPRFAQIVDTTTAGHDVSATIVLTAVPTAQVAKSLNGKTETDFVAATSGVTAVLTTLQSGGSSGQILSKIGSTLAWVPAPSFMPPIITGAASQVVIHNSYPNIDVSLADIVASGSAARINYDSKGRVISSGPLLYSDLPITQGSGISITNDGTSLIITSTVSGGSGASGITSISGNPGEISTSGTTIGLANFGSAGTYYNVTTDNKGRVISGTSSLATTDISSGVFGISRGGTGLNHIGSPFQVLAVTSAGAVVSYTTISAGPGVFIDNSVAGVMTISVSGSLVTSNSVTSSLGYTPADSSTVLYKTNNLSDLISATAARANLGLGPLATPSSLDLGSALASGTLAVARLPSFTGDVTSLPGSSTMTLATTGVTSGVYTKVTVDAKGRVASATQLSASDITTALGFMPVSAATAVTSGITTLNGLTAVTQNFAVGIAGTNFNIMSSGGIHTFNIPLASAATVTGGLLSNADYATFMNKMPNTFSAVTSALGYTPADSSTVLYKASNLSDLNSPATARANLGLGALATSSTLDLSSALAVGTLSPLRLPSFVGDVSSASGTNLLTLSTTGVTAGTYTKLTVDAKGRITTGLSLTTSDVAIALGYLPTSSTAAVLKAGDSMSGELFLAPNSATSAPLHFTSGALKTSPVGGDIEYDSANLYYTSSSGTIIRRSIASGKGVGRIDDISSINSSGTVTILASIFSVNANSIFGTGNFTGQLSASATTASLTPNTGALVVAGGVGIGGSLNANGDIYTYGNLGSTGTITAIQGISTSGTISASGGIAVTSGGITVSRGNIAVSGTIQISGSGSNVIYSCGSSEAGKQRYNTTQSAMEFCNGSVWQGINGVTHCSAGWTLAGTPGTRSAFCIQSNSPNMNTDWTTANNACSNTMASNGFAHLCSVQQKLFINNHAIAVGDTGNYEWSQDLAGGGSNAYFYRLGDNTLVGASFTATSYSSSSIYYRCCYE